MVLLVRFFREQLVKKLAVFQRLLGWTKSTLSSFTWLFYFCRLFEVPVPLSVFITDKGTGAHQRRLIKKILCLNIRIYINQSETAVYINKSETAVHTVMCVYITSKYQPIRDCHVNITSMYQPIKDRRVCLLPVYISTNQRLSCVYITSIYPRLLCVYITTISQPIRDCRVCIYYHIFTSITLR